MGTAYAVWTGMGTAGIFGLGIVLYGDPTSAARFAGVGLIIAGVALLQLAS